MEFNNRLYELRKQKGLSQEELAGRINVSRQTISKWEIGDSTPDMEKLVALSDLFEVSLDELILGKKPEPAANTVKTPEMTRFLEEKVLTDENKRIVVKILKIAGIGLGVIFVIDLVSMLVYFLS